MIDWEIAKLDAATIVERKDEMIYCPWSQKWFADEEEWIDYYEHHSDYEVFPNFAFIGRKHRFQLDIESVLENEADNHETEDEYDIREDLIGLDELRAFIENWNAQQYAHTWEEDYKRKVDMRPWHAKVLEARKQ